jgi:putative transposase
VDHADAYDADQFPVGDCPQRRARRHPQRPLAIEQAHPLYAHLYAHLYAQRHLVECCFSKLQQFRRVAPRFEKTAANYLAVITIAAAVLWMR